MNVCIVFILLAQDDHNRNYLKSQESFIAKLLSIYKTLERRSELNAKKKQDKQLISTITATRDQLLNTTASASSSSNPFLENNKAKQSTTVSFTFGPDWSLTKKAVIELNDSLHALKYFLNLLSIQLYSESEMKPTVHPKLTSTSRAIFDQKTSFQRMQMSNLNRAKALSTENCASHKMNSLVMTSGVNRTFCKNTSNLSIPKFGSEK
jgi:hypothetical protein